MYISGGLSLSWLCEFFEDCLLMKSSEMRNPFVELAIQHSIAAAYATFDETKKQTLCNMLLKGKLDIFLICFCYELRCELIELSVSDLVTILVMQVWILPF